ncbi:MAG TPA: DUF1207 domain-containing protein [Candidatus Polarisedimenticolia bacterium]|nr:DUF1207 domain-containing protein [Candidatus Polarisedimenticolia bacterium]
MRRLPLLILFAVALGAGAPPARAGDAGPATAGAPSGAEADAYLRGYVASWLATAHGLGTDRLTVEVADGTVILTGTADSPEQIDLIVATVASFAGVVRVVNRIEVAPAAQAGAPVQAPGRWRTWRAWLHPLAGRKSVRFPIGDLFTAPLADQKQPRFHTTYQRTRVGFGTFDIASVGFGENFGLVRWPRKREGDGWQVGISGAVFAIFNLDSGSKDLLNADYIVGFPISYRSGDWSARLRVFHQSSHLGDEFLLLPQPGPPVTRINLSYEALELLGSRERRGLRVYGGATRIFASDTPLGRRRLQAGVDFRGNPRHWRTARVIAGVDVEAWDETDWDRDWSFKGGLQFRSPYGDARSLQLLLEYYNGHSPHGQFFTLNIEYVGLGIAYAF